MDLHGRLADLARSNGGLVTTAMAGAEGISGQRLTDLSRRGVIARVTRGCYAVSGGPPRAAADPRATTITHRVVLSHCSAAAWWGAELPAPVARTHVTAPRNRGRRRGAIAGAVLHRAALGAADVVSHRGLRVTSPLRTAVDVGRHCSLEHAVAIVDSMLRARLITHDELAVAAAAVQGPGRRRLQLVVMLADPQSGSVLESLTRVLLWRRQLRPPRSQFALRDRRLGWIGRVDFAWPELRVILECDGYEWHSGRAPFQDDRRRYSAVARAGWRLGVVTWFDVTCDPLYVVALVRDLLAGPGLEHITGASVAHAAAS